MGKSCREKTHHFCHPCPVCVPPPRGPATAPAEDLLPAQACQVPCLQPSGSCSPHLPPWVQGAQQVQGSETSIRHTQWSTEFCRVVIAGRDSTGQESSKSTPDGAFLLGGDGGSITAQIPTPCSHAATEQSPWVLCTARPQHRTWEQHLPSEARVYERLSWNLPLGGQS